MIDYNFKSNQRLGGYKLVSMLGGGLSGEVWSAVSDMSSSIVALKIFRRDSVLPSQVKYEYEMATQMEHPNLLKPLFVEEVDGYWVMGMPYCLGRSVDGVTGYMQENHLWKLLHDVSSGLSALHMNGVGHFDIKPSNVLWDGYRFVISDFGSCQKLNIYRDECLTTMDDSSYRFDAPELTKGFRHSASDIWSLGATVFNLFMGCHVFYGLGGRVQQKTSPIPYMRRNMPELSELIIRCLAYDYNQRPTADEIVTTARMRLEIQSSMVKERPIKQVEQIDSIKNKSYFWTEEMIEL